MHLTQLVAVQKLFEGHNLFVVCYSNSLLEDCTKGKHDNEGTASLSKKFIVFLRCPPLQPKSSESHLKIYSADKFSDFASGI